MQPLLSNKLFIVYNIPSMHSANHFLDHFDFDEEKYFENDGSGEVVAKYYSSLEAEMAAARLRAEGIPCFLANTASQSVLTHLPILVRLHVRPQDFELAQMILAEAAIDMEPPENAATPPIFSFWNLLAIAAALILALLALFFWHLSGQNHLSKKIESLDSRNFYLRKITESNVLALGGNKNFVVDLG